ncbi:MAG TPA: hypothetical protein VK504_17415 [Vicinamibacterales bacterium]|nr:hypothetical protein [Vicinamibacterales bacterium]
MNAEPEEMNRDLSIAEHASPAGFAAVTGDPLVDAIRREIRLTLASKYGVNASALHPSLTTGASEKVPE